MLKRMSLYEKAVWLMLLLYFLLIFIIFALVGREGSRFGGILMLMPVAAAFFFCLIHYRGTIRIHFNSFFFYMLFFGLYCMVNSLWAVNPGVAFSRGVQTIEKLIVMMVFFLCFQELENAVEDYLLALMWGGFLFGTFYILYYGPSYVLSSIINGKRTDSTLLNINTLGVCAAYSLMIFMHFCFNKKAKLWWLIFALSSFVCVLASQSRKALIVLALGVAGFFFLRTIQQKDIRKTLLKVLTLLLILVLILFLLSRWTLFSAYFERFRGLIEGLSGASKMDKSTWERIQLKNLGKTLFLQNPIGGVGIDSPRSFSFDAIGKENMYLHDNYIELLAGGGIIAVVLYYWIYAVLFVDLIRRRKNRDTEWIICFLILAFSLIMDYGSVSYHEKSTYFYLMAVYLYSEKTNSQRTGRHGARCQLVKS